MPIDKPRPYKRKAAASTKPSSIDAKAGSSKPLPDIYQRITDQIVKAIEAGAGDWKMPWHSGKDADASLPRPVNAFSGKPYRGVNVLALWTATAEQGYRSSQWATYKQWEESGAQVRKGEKSTCIVFWKINDKGEETSERESDSTDDEKRDDRRTVFARGYAVFNRDQVDGYKPNSAQPTAPLPAPAPEEKRIAQADQFFAGLGADIRHGGNRAFYRPATDHIQMPHFAAFPDPINYYSTLGHEAAHWTSAKHRLDRDLTGRFGSEAYAAEELIAELSAAFLSADLQLTNEPRPDHAAYVANWLKVLKNDNRAIFTAAARSQQAVDFLHDLQASASEPKLVEPPAAPLVSAYASGQFRLDL